MNNLKEDRLSSMRFIGEFKCQYCGAKYKKSSDFWNISGQCTHCGRYNLPNSVACNLYSILFLKIIAIQPNWDLFFVWIYREKLSITIVCQHYTFRFIHFASQRQNLISKIQFERKEQWTKFKEESTKIHISCYNYW